jgi:hypothetical protein
MGSTITDSVNDSNIAMGSIITESVNDSNIAMGNTITESVNDIAMGSTIKNLSMIVI